MSIPLVGILMGSDSDFPVVKDALKTLKDFGVEYEVEVASAHRTPEIVANYSKTARERGLKVILAAAGAAAHLAGVIASHTTLPVLGIPVNATPLAGFDSLLSTVQMPAGIPVATFAVGKSGATNAALFAVSILAVSDESLAVKLGEFRNEMGDKVAVKAEKLKMKLKDENL